MATETFPTYGTLLDFDEKPGRKPVLRTEMERGPAKQLNLSSSTYYDHAVTYVYTLAEYGTWKTWFSSNVNNGTDWFNWTHPFSGASVEGRIKEGSFSANLYSKSGTHVAVKMTIETLG